MEWIKVARKLAMVEADLERAEERAETGESWVNIDYLIVFFWRNSLFSVRLIYC